MFALVRFVEDFADNTLQVILVDDIEDFHPKNDTDFDSKATYSAYWNDKKNDTNSGYFIVQILRLAETVEEMDEKRLKKRIILPPIHRMEVLDEEEASLHNHKRILTQESKKKRKNQAVAKKLQCQAIMKQHMSHAVATLQQSKTAQAEHPLHGCTSGGRGEGGERDQSRAVPYRSHANFGKKVKRKRTFIVESDSDADNSTESASALRRAEQEAQFWRQQFRREQRLSTTLQGHIEFLEKKLEQKLTSIHMTLQDMSQTERPQRSSLLRASPPPTSPPPTSPPPPSPPLPSPPPPSLLRASPPPAVVLKALVPPPVPAPHAATPGEEFGDFSETGDGRVSCFQ
ncbi:uncharacterized protein LOC144180458 [Haemaphysalis longicornis]